MIRKITNLVTLVLLLQVTSATFAHSPPAKAKIYFMNLEDGSVVSNPVEIKFGIQGFGITPAGTTGKRRHNAGHHHLLVDVKQLPDMDQAIPSDSQHIHFDQGETETTMDLPLGRHTLQLLLGDEDHEPQDPPLISEKITITVQ